MSIRQRKSKTSRRRFKSLILSVAVFMTVFPTGGFTLTKVNSAAVSAAPDPDSMYAYGTEPCAVYIASGPSEGEATYRVYSDSTKQDLIGRGSVNAKNNYKCVISLAYTPGITAYVSRQAAGAEESYCTAVDVSAYKPSIQLKIRPIQDATKSLPMLVNGSDAYGYYGYPFGSYGPYAIEEGKYYEVTLLLNHMAALDVVQIPLRYNTELFEPACVYTVRERNPNTMLYEQKSKVRAADPAKLSAAAKGTYIKVIDNSSFYGVLRGTGFSTWANGACFPDASGGAYQTINTTTGLIKLQAATGSLGGSPASFGTNEWIPDKNVTKRPEFLRVIFRAKQSAQALTLPVWFATESDCPEIYRNTSEAEKYYDITNPNGPVPTLFGANVMAPPPCLKPAGANAGIGTLMALSADDLGTALPNSYYIKSADLAQLSPDEVKVYNYTNWCAGGAELAPYKTLDGANLNAYDRLVIGADCNSLGNGDEIRVYNSLPVQYDSPYKSAVYSANTGATVNLGSEFLAAGGGTVYVSVLRKDVSGNIAYSSDAVNCPVEYPAEAKREVTFRIYRGDWKNDSKAKMFYGPENGRAPTGEVGRNTGTPLADVTADERLQLRIYFNDFYELMSYGFSIHFDPSYVRLADIDYGDTITTGTVHERDYKNEKSCFSVGRDLANVTLTEQTIYQAWLAKDETAWEDTDKDGVEEEIPVGELQIASLMTLYNLNRAQFEQIAADVHVKYTLGVTAEGELPWKGGLLFNERDDTTGFPYVDCENGNVRFVSATLEQCPLELQRDAGGYHFISINFVAIRAGDPGFRLAKLGDEGYDQLHGQEIALLDDLNVSGLKTQQTWEVWPMGDTMEMQLRRGNALPEDKYLYASTDDEFIYNKYIYDEYLFYDRAEEGEGETKRIFNSTAYRDPGYEVRRADGSRVPTDTIERWYMKGSSRQDLLWSANEEHTNFIIPDGDYSAKYVINYHYEYESTTGTKELNASRNLYVIYKKGDVNGDGSIDVFDEQTLADDLNAIFEFDRDNPTYPLFEMKTADITKDSVLSTEDRDAVRASNQSISPIKQDYQMRVP